MIGQELRKDSRPSIDECCNASCRERNLHEQLSDSYSKYSQVSITAEKQAEGYKTLLEMLPIGLTDKQQSDIRQIIKF